MEDDDEFGDLYTDVLQSFESSRPSSAPAAPPPPQSLPRPIDLNLKTDDHDEVLTLPPHSNPNSQTLAPAADSTRAGDSAAAPPRVLDPKDVKLPDRDADLAEKDVNFDIEEEAGNNGIGDMGLDAVIPGLSDAAAAAPVNNNNNNSEANMEGSRRDDDWDSDDSEDDLQIVLNDNNPHGPMAMERGNGEEDDDDGLVIVADSELNQAGADEQDWGEEGQQAADGERKEMGEAGKPGGGSGGAVMAPKVGYSNHGYHPFHSQFKVSLAVLIY